MTNKQKTTRRQFLKGAAAAGAGGFAAGMAPAAVLAQAESMETDVVVCGSGIAGMAAAIEAARAGARVIVLEKAKTIGGNSKWAGGFDVESTTYEQMRQEDPEGDPWLQEATVTNFQGDLEWLMDIGVDLAETRPGRFDLQPYLGEGGILAWQALRAALEEAGGEILVETPMVKLLTDDMDAVVGVRARNADGLLDIMAKAVVIATGSFGQSPEMKLKYLGPYGDRTSYYGTPDHQGDGLRAALALGAATTTGLSIADGGVVCPPPFQAPDDLMENPITNLPMSEPVPSGVVNLWVRPPGWGEPCILVNLHGKRYVDESSRYTVIGWKTSLQPEGLGFCVFDQTVVDRSPRMYELVKEYGGILHQADTIEELAEMMRDNRLTQSYKEGVAVANFLQTFQEYNEAVDAETTLELDPPRRANAVKIETPPFYAMPAVQGTVDIIGGLKLNENCQVLDTNGWPIAGLYAAGEDTGRPYTVEHGGMSHGLITGRIAGRAAAG